MTEASLRDLYAWNEDLLRLLLRMLERQPAPSPSGNLEPQAAVDAALLFEWMAQRSSNLEHRAAIASLNERLHVVRMAEGQLFPAAGEELKAWATLIGQGRWLEARRMSVSYHAARLRRVPELAGLLQRRRD
jgi:hypothetical protein